MKLKLLAICLVLSCGAPEFSDEEQFGDLGESITAKFATGFTYGSCDTATHEKAVTNNSCAGQAVLPGKTAIKYVLSGADNFSGNIYKSWKAEMDRAFSSLATNMQNTGPCPSTPWSFTKVDPVAAHDVIVVPGDCPGDPTTSPNINSFVCVSYDAGTTGTGTFVTVTEPFSGGYKRNNNMRVRITVDMPAILLRGGSNDLSVHYLLEHGTHLAVAIVAGMGSYPASKPFSGWTSPNTVTSPFSGNDYNFDDWTREELCSACSYAITQTPNVFSQQSGVCTN